MRAPRCIQNTKPAHNRICDALIDHYDNDVRTYEAFVESSPVTVYLSNFCESNLVTTKKSTTLPLTHRVAKTNYQTETTSRIFIDPFEEKLLLNIAHALLLRKKSFH